jgi:hypothetical protein
LRLRTHAAAATAPTGIVAAIAYGLQLQPTFFALDEHLLAVLEEALRELRSREEATRRAEAAVGARDEAIRSKDAEIARLRRLAYGVEVLDVDAGVTRVVEEAGAGAEPPLKRMRLEKPASARVVGALQERLVR